MKATATPFVHHALKDTILKIMESKQSCEVKGGWRKGQSQVSLLFCIFREKRPVLHQFRANHPVSDFKNTKAFSAVSPSS